MTLVNTLYHKLLWNKYSITLLFRLKKIKERKFQSKKFKILINKK